MVSIYNSLYCSKKEHVPVVIKGLIWYENCHCVFVNPVVRRNLSETHREKKLDFMTLAPA